MEANEKIEEIKRKVINPETYLVINRVPRKVKREFLSWADEEFEGDYGMALKWIWDFKCGLLSTPNSVLIEQMETIENEIEQLKNGKQEEPKKKIIRSVSGRTILEKEEKENVETSTTSREE